MHEGDYDIAPNEGATHYLAQISERLKAMEKNEKIIISLLLDIKQAKDVPSEPGILIEEKAKQPTKRKRR